MNSLLIALVVLGALSFAVGVGLMFLPAGLMTLGAEMVAGAYVLAYLRARR